MEKYEKFILWCDKAMAFSFYALIYFLPISIALSETFTVLALVCFFLKRGATFYGRLRESSSSGNRLSLVGKITCFLKSFKPVSSSLNWPIVFLLFFSFVSVMFSEHYLVSLKGFLGKVLQSAFIYFNFIECMNSKKRLKIFFTVFFVSCTLICINGIFQAVVGHGFIHGHIFEGRISSSMRQANDFAAYLVVVVPILFFLVFLTTSKKRSDIGKTDDFMYLNSIKVKIACLILFLLAFLCFGLTYSRGAWVGFVLSLLLASLFGVRSLRAIISNGLLVVLFLVAFYPGISYVNIPWHKFYYSSEKNSLADVSSPSANSSSLPEPDHASLPEPDHAENLRKEIYEKFRMTDNSTFLIQNNRLAYWKRSLKVIKDYPLFGCGLNTYALIEGRYSDGLGGYPHNSYLQMTAETGLIGIIVFLWLLIVLFYDSLKALRIIKVQADKMLFFGFLTGLLGFLIHSFFDTNFYSVQLSSLLWVIIGVIVALQRVEKA